QVFASSIQPAGARRRWRPARAPAEAGRAKPKPEPGRPSTMFEEGLQAARILIVDDQEANVRLLEQMLRRTGYLNLLRTTEPRDVPALCDELRPDLILLDLHMPNLNGFGVMEQLTPRLPERTYLPIVMLTADATPEVKQRALAIGVHDFLTKP